MEILSEMYTMLAGILQRSTGRTADIQTRNPSEVEG